MKTYKIARILRSTTSDNTFDCVDNVFRLGGITLPSEVDEEVLLISNIYREIFGKRKKMASNHQKRLSIVKICANGQSVHRAFRAVSAKDFTGGYVALTSNTINLLRDKEGHDPLEVELSKGCIFHYYCFHPDKAIRLSAKLGSLSLLLGVLSIIVSILGMLT